MENKNNATDVAKQIFNEKNEETRRQLILLKQKKGYITFFDSLKIMLSLYGITLKHYLWIGGGILVLSVFVIFMFLK